MNNQLGFEKRRPYQAALELNQLAIQVCSRIPTTHQLMADELSRSAMMLVQYVALHYGVPDNNAKRQAFSNATGAFHRVLSALVIALQHGYITDEELEQSRLLCKRIQKW
ncbi:MAG TPA: four helix bundle protein [Anaerolineaceae bacterium]|nr:four helix bundle protein [Anaerolineaceae bacterium]